MTIERRQIVLFVALVAALLAASLWSYSRYADAAARAARATEESRLAGELAREIHTLRQQPTLDGANELDDLQLSRLLYDAADAAEVSPDQAVRSIRSLPARRVGSGREASLYRQVSTEVKLEGLTLEQLVRLSHTLVSRNPGLRVESLYLTSPSGQGTQTRWNVDPLVLSYLVYDPRADDR